MPLTHTRNFRIRHYECDAFGYLNNANYVRYMQESVFDASTAAGYDQARYAELGHHFKLPLAIISSSENRMAYSWQPTTLWEYG